jgi:hypothetical protein
MLTVFAGLVRISYLFAALAALIFNGPPLLQFARSLLQPTILTRNSSYEIIMAACALLGLIAPASRALLRLLRHAELVPLSHLRERPVVATLVGVTSLCGNALALLVAWGVLSTLPESRGLNFAGPMMLAFMLFAFALLTGEMVLVGRSAPAER